MNELALALPIVVPAAFWAAYHYYRDRHLPEPVDHLFAALMLGVLAAGVSKLLYLSLGLLDLRFDALALADSSAFGLLLYAMLAIGPIEELSKLAPFVLLVLRFDKLDEPLDGIIYASFIGLGYAAVENWEYLQYLTVTEAYARGFASPVVHIVFASIWGHRITKAHLAGRPVAPAAFSGLAIAAGLHGVYDFIVLLSPQKSLPLAALIIGAVWVWRLKLMHVMHEHATRDR